MAWIAEDNFNSYSNGDLGTLNGGTGFSAGWVDNGGTISVADTPANFEGNKGVTASASASAIYDRALTSTVTAGTAYIHMKSSSASSIFFFILTEGGNGRMYIKFDSDGNIKIFSNGSGTYITLCAYQVDTWYEIAIDFNTATNANSYRASVNGGAYSSYYTVSGGSLTNIGGVRLERDNTAGNVYWDNITPTAQSLTSSLVSYWKLDESSGNASDSLGVNTLTNTGVTYGTGKINNGADFERSDSTDELIITDAAQTGLDLTSMFTLAAWVKFESTVGSNEVWSVISKITGFETAYSFMFGYREDGGPKGLFFAETSDGTNGGTGVSGIVSWTPSNGTWYHVAVVFDGSQTGVNRVRYFINGVGAYSATSGWHTSIYSGAASFRVGNSGTGNAFDGMIDEVGVYNRALTDGEISQLYNGSNGSQYSFTNVSIALDYASIREVGGSGSATFSFSHRASGTNRVLFVYAEDNNGGDTVTGVTYAGVTMTKIGASVQVPSGPYVTLWYLVAPATGTNNVTITRSQTTGSIIGMSVSYTGVNQTGIPDSSNTGTGSSTTSLSIATTTVLNNSWYLLVGANESGQTWTAVTGTQRITGNRLYLDSNAPKTPAGSATLTGSMSIGNVAGIAISFAPISMTSIKTVNGLAVASVKTFDGLAIASIKNINGLA